MRKEWSLIALGLLFFNPGIAHAFVNEQWASYVLGQTNFTNSSTYQSGTTYTVTPNNFVDASDVLYDPVYQHLFVADILGRVLVFDLSGGLTTNMAATWVLGEPNMTTINPTESMLSSPSSLYSANALAYDSTLHHERLFVADFNYQRILIFNIPDGVINPGAPTVGMNASYVIGNDTFYSPMFPNGQLLSQQHPSSMMFVPFGLAYDPVTQYLFVATGYYQNRILVFDVSAGNMTNYPAPTGSTQLTPMAKGPMPAIYELGQPHVDGVIDFTTTAPATTQSGFSGVTSVSIDSNARRLYAADQINNRVMVFDLSQGITNGMNAVNVIGQSNFNSAALNLSQNSVPGAMVAKIDPASQRLFVINDWPLNPNGLPQRISIFNLSGGITNGMNASTVLGATNFTSYPIQGPTAYAFFSPAGMGYDPAGLRLFVGDSDRMLIFSDSDPTLGNTPPVCGSNNQTAICGTVTDSVSHQPLPNVPVQLLNSQGTLLQDPVLTQSNGTFIFTNLTGGATYYVTPVVGRSMSAIPVSVPVPNLTVVGSTVTLQVRGWPGSVQISGPAGSTILLSNQPYTNASPTDLSPSLPLSAGYYTAALPASGTTVLKVPDGTYYLTCWEALVSSGTLNFQRMPSAPGSVAIGLVSPTNGTVKVSCP